MSIAITIDQRPIEAEPGQTILAVARGAGFDIPALCHTERCGPMNSCLVCVVKVTVQGRTSVVPSCGVKVQPGMVVESETQEVRDLRRTALELLLSDHVGDCLSPCHRICPLGLNIPVMLRHVEAGRIREAIDLVQDTLPMPGITGRLCNHPCENGCRRNVLDRSMAIRDVERFVADQGLASASSLPACKPSTGLTVAILGSGPSGLAAAWQLARLGHECTVVDRNGEAGGSLRRMKDEAALPRGVIESELRQLERLGVRFKLGVALGRDVTIEGLERGFDAVLIATGSRALAEAGDLGIGMSTTGIRADAASCQTSIKGVFAAGAAVRPLPNLTRAMAAGVAAARAIHRWLVDGAGNDVIKPFSSVMGKVDRQEAELFLRPGQKPSATSTDCGGCVATGAAGASVEAGRCLHCDCRAAGSCGLQHYAQSYGADAGRFPRQRRRFEQHANPCGVIFEPGKCILCGICVEIARQAEEPLGLTFIGRGFDVRVGAPLNREFEEGLQRVAEECAENCPTGAIVLGDETARDRRIL